MKTNYISYIINTCIVIAGFGAAIIGIGIDRILPTVSGYWFLIPGIILLIVGVVGIIQIVCFNTFGLSIAFNYLKKRFSDRDNVLSAQMKNTGEGNNGVTHSLTWDLAAKVHINTTKSMTIAFDRCTAEFKHNQYKDMAGDFGHIFLIKEEYRNNDVNVYKKFRELEVSQIVIDRPSTVTLLAMFKTSVWQPGNKESLKILFKLPVSEKNCKPLKISVEMLKVGAGMDFATTT